MPDSTGLGYVLPEHAYGEPLLGDEKMRKCTDQFAVARRMTTDLIDMIQRMRVFPICGINGANERFNVISYESCHAAVLAVLNMQVPVHGDHRLITREPGGLRAGARPPPGGRADQARRDRRLNARCAAREPEDGNALI